jgi:hypothetical protein
MYFPPMGCYYQRMSTKLEAFLRSRDIKPRHLVKTSGYSRQHLLMVREGKREPTRPCIAAITGACQRLSGERVKAADLFELEPEYRD